MRNSNNANGMWTRLQMPTLLLIISVHQCTNMPVVLIPEKQDCTPLQLQQASVWDGVLVICWQDNWGSWHTFIPGNWIQSMAVPVAFEINSVTVSSAIDNSLPTHTHCCQNRMPTLRLVMKDHV
jgi:hypothetical protein